MNDMAKAARAAMKDKAKRLVKNNEGHRIDASSFEPAEPLDAPRKTGLRPVSRPNFKRGGKVMHVKGEAAKHHAGRKPRKSGGATYAKDIADEIVNRNVKDANAKDFGAYHVGGYKKGGKVYRKHRDDGGMTGANDPIGQYIANDKTAAPASMANTRSAPSRPSTAQIIQNAKDLQMMDRQSDARRAAQNAADQAAARKQMMKTEPFKKGGSVHRKHRDAGGFQPGVQTDPRSLAAAQVNQGVSRANVPPSMMNFSGVKGGRLNPLYNKGGKVHKMHPDEAEDKALIRKMVKHDALTGKKHGGSALAKGKYMVDHQGNPEKGGRIARKHGGSAKGKTNVNIIVNPHHPSMGGQPPMGGMPPMPPRPQGQPVPVAPPQGMPPQGAAPMAMPVPVAMPQGGQPPMGRKRGGRAYPIHDGAGGGEGRLQKIKAYGAKPVKGKDHY